MKSLIHYVFRHPVQIKTSENKFNVKFVQKEFVDESPILARERALEFYNNYVEVYEEGLRLKAEKKLENEFFEDVHFDIVGAEVDLGTIKPPFYEDDIQKGIPMSDFFVWYSDNPEWIFEAERGPALIMVKHKSLLKDENDPVEIIIQEYNLNEDNADPYEVCKLMMYLDEEVALYAMNDYDTGDSLITVPFWDAEVYDNGGEGELIFEDHQILDTGFDWHKYSVPNWWNDPDLDEMINGNLADLMPTGLVQELQTLLNPMELPQTSKPNIIPSVSPRVKRKKTDHERISLGETIKVEFKPCLFQQTENRCFPYEAAKTICAFLNQKGGYLYVGVADDCSIIGVDLTGMSRDDFLRRFTSEIVNYYLERGVSDACIRGEFIDMENRPVFRVKVNASTKPVFLLNKIYQPLQQEFYIRREASSYLIRNPRHLIDYVENHWWRGQRKRR